MITLEESIKRRTGSEKLIGCYTINEDGNACITDIRGIDGEPVSVNGFNLNETEIPVKSKNLVLDEFYTFNWHVADEDNKILSIQEDTLKPVDKEKLLNRLFSVYANKKGKDLQDSINFQNTIFTEVTGADHTYIYELLQNANDYPYEGEDDDVHVRFEVTPHYLLFLHTGAEFNLRNIVGICSINQGEKKKNKQTIGYKGIGFKTVFVNNNYVYLHSGDWSLRFDKNFSEEQCMGECAWSLMPIPTEVDNLDSELKEVLSKISPRYRVQFALRHKDDASKNIPLLKKVFENDQILLFIPHMSEVEVFFNGEKKYDIKKDSEHWIVNSFKYEIPNELKNWVNNNIDSGGSRIPEKFRDIEAIGISFAVSKDGDKLVPVEDSRVYNYLPTELKLQFPFLINADFIPNGSRSRLHETRWNDEVMKQCGRQFVDWWRSFLVKEGEWDLNSVFSILPDASSKDRYAKLFIEGLFERIQDVECIPTEIDGNYCLVRIDEIIYDEVGLTDTNKGVIRDEEFYSITKTNKHLPHKSIRSNKKLYDLLCEDFRSSIELFNEDTLAALCDRPSFKEWLKIPSNDIKFIKYVAENDYFNNISHKRIFLTEQGTLESAENIYYNIDVWLEDLSFLSDYLPRIKRDVRIELESIPKWKNNIEKFKHFSDFNFAKEILSYFYAKIEGRLHDLSNNIKFIHFLAKSGYQVNFQNVRIPVFDDHEVCHYNLKGMYLPASLGSMILQQSWANTDWYTFPNKEYFNKDTKEVSQFFQRLGLVEFNSRIFFDNIISSDEAIAFIASKIRTKEVNISFYRFLSENLSDIKPSDKKVQDKMRNKFTLIATDGKTQIMVPINTVVYLKNDDWVEAASQKWMPQNALLCLSEDYFKNLEDERQEKLRFFLCASNRQIVQSFTWRSLGNNFQNNKILPAILAGIKDKETSCEFLDFLFNYKKELFKGNELNSNFLNIPIKVDGVDALTNVNDLKSKLYYHSEDLDTLFSEKWFVKEDLKVADICYKKLFDGTERKLFFRQLGFLEFNPIGYIKNLLSNDIEKLSSSIQDKDSNLSFHKYVFSIRQKLTSEDFELIKQLPIYLSSPNNPKGEVSEKSYDHYLPSDTLNTVISLDIVPISILDTIHPDYISTEEEKKYYENSLDNVVLNIEDFIDYITQDDNKIVVCDYLKESRRNIRFWRWVVDSKVNAEQRKKLSDFPIMCNFTIDGKDSFTSPKEVYISNRYVADDVESLIREYTKNPIFVSSKYIREGEDANVWLKLFKSIHMSVDMHDLVFESILPNISTYNNKDIVSVLADFEEDIQNKIKDEEENDVKKQIMHLHILCNDGIYREPSQAFLSGSYIGVTINTIPDIILPNLISEEYISTEIPNEKRSKIKRLLTDIMDSLDRGLSLTELRNKKLEYFVEHQKDYDKETHMKIIGEIASQYKIDHDDVRENLINKDIYLYNQANELCLSRKLTLGSRYKPDCDFQANGVEDLNYISDDYASLFINLNDRQSFLCYLLHVNYRFTEEDVKFLSTNSFAKYFWNDYVSKHKDDIKNIFANRKQASTYCIPTSKGVKRPIDVYDNRFPQLVKIVLKLPDCTGKLPSVEIPEWLNNIGINTRLSLLDCLEYLRLDIRDYRREYVYLWITESKDTIRRYKNEIENFMHEAKWFTGEKKWEPLKNLVALEWGNLTLKGNFGNSNYICNPSNMPEKKADYERLCEIFHIKILYNSDFRKRKKGEWHTDEKAKSEMRNRLLYLAYKKGTDDWLTSYKKQSQQLDKCDICTCESIEYYYNDNISTDLLSYTEEDDKLWYVGEWNSKMFLNVIKWFTRVFGYSDFQDSYIEKIFNVDFKTILVQNDVDFPKEFLDELDDKTRTGLKMGEEEPDDDDSNNYWNSIHSEEEQEAQSNSVDNNTIDNVEDVPDIDANPSDNDKEETDINNEDINHNDSVRQRKERSDKGQHHQMSGRSSEANHEQETGTSTEQDINEKLRTKWEERKNTTLGKPHSSSNSNNYEEDQSWNSPSKYELNEEDDFSEEGDFDDEPKRDTSALTQRSLTRKYNEAQDAVTRSKDEKDIYDQLKSTPKYSFLWFKYLMELMYADKSDISKRTIDVDFRDFEIISDEKVIRLKNPNRVIPTWCVDANRISITAISNDNDRKGIKDLCPIHCDEISIDFKIKDIDKLNQRIHDAQLINVKAEDSNNFVDALQTRFIQLDLPDEYDMCENLPNEISFVYGPPGTGKTTKLEEYIHRLIEDNENINILVLTPTNKAADVIAKKLADDDVTYPFISRYGSTDDTILVEKGVVTTRDTMDMDIDSRNVVITTGARYPYDTILPDDTCLCDFAWDYIIIDEASMMDLLSITYILYKGKGAKFIIAGDPMQIRPIRQNNIDIENIYQMLGIDELKTAITDFKRYPLTALQTQYRSVPTIGNFISNFAYNGLVHTDPHRASQKPLIVKGMDFKTINLLGFEVREFDDLYGLGSVNGSALHLYSAIFTYNLSAYIAEQVKSNIVPKEKYSIGIVCPYKAEADAIKQMIEARPIENDYCSITCGTAHSFQGDECDIMFVVLNPPANVGTLSHINDRNIVNVAMSRARDYLFLVMPQGQIDGYNVKKRIYRALNVNDKAIMSCKDLEKVMFDNDYYIEENTEITCHMPVNVYYNSHAKYDVRWDDTALDIQIHDYPDDINN